ncbi:uncharacterized protein BO87DRAFT_218320 [Aspergillus neoniger CBS 115656]|uniref:Uncharacterized protein n=1 Tax=Aspergillus neoniger (strain CBS 115656) TaxID=1448310 RepID=A0A318YZ55_ASPNB|nr:hypothetical protein BO87DRAFT_218320 [Aspergillus neoniger CBS 115656]PYH36980.1 hypothetical protein BO87DRAFT_218320 [Aspergillus neoniger CBS 115656]
MNMKMEPTSRYDSVAALCLTSCAPQAPRHSRCSHGASLIRTPLISQSSVCICKDEFIVSITFPTLCLPVPNCVPSYTWAPCSVLLYFCRVMI